MILLLGVLEVVFNFYLRRARGGPHPTPASVSECPLRFFDNTLAAAGRDVRANAPSCVFALFCFVWGVVRAPIIDLVAKQS